MRKMSVVSAIQVPEESSYIDFGYGSTKVGSSLAGVHRISVARLPYETDEGEGWANRRQNQANIDDGGRVMITWESYTICPGQDGSMLMDWAWKYHKKYASALFSRGVFAVVMGEGRSARTQQLGARTTDQLE